MVFTKQADFTKKVTDLTDVPSQNMPPSEIKTYFQTPSDELKDTLNKLVDDLNADSWVDPNKLAPNSIIKGKVAPGSIGTSEIDPNIINQPNTLLGAQAQLQQVNEQLADNGNKIGRSGNRIFIEDYPIQTPEIDDTARIKRAFADGGKGKTYEFSNKSYIVSDTLEFPLDSQVVGNGSFIGGDASVSGHDGVSRITFNLPAGIVGMKTTGYSVVMENIFFDGVNKANTGLSVTGDIRARNVHFFNWDCGIDFTLSNYYSTLITPEFYNCNVGIKANSGVYNLHLIVPKFSLCTTAISSTTTVRALTIHGGSVEGFGVVGAFKLAAGSNISFFGTYFETQTSGAFGIDLSGGNSQTLNLYGCTIYLSKLSRFVNMSGITSAVLNGSGNRFVYDSTTNSNPIAYYLPASGQVNLFGDQWNDCQAGAEYVQNYSLLQTKNFNIQVPEQITNGLKDYLYANRPLSMKPLTSAPTSPIKGAVYMADGYSWNPLGRAFSSKCYPVYYDGAAYQPFGNPEIIATSQRPITPVNFVPFIDNSIKKLIWYNGTSWQDALGNNV